MVKSGCHGYLLVVWVLTADVSDLGVNVMTDEPGLTREKRTTRIAEVGRPWGVEGAWGCRGRGGGSHACVCQCGSRGVSDPWGTLHPSTGLIRAIFPSLKSKLTYFVQNPE